VSAPLTDSERTLAVMLDAWNRWECPPRTTDDPEWARAKLLRVFGSGLESLGLVKLFGDDMTAAGRDLLDRARKAGVLPREPLTEDEARAWVPLLDDKIGPYARPVDVIADALRAASCGDIPPEVRKP
jgi:hypothetical protein